MPARGELMECYFMGKGDWMWSMLVLATWPENADFLPKYLENGIPTAARERDREGVWVGEGRVLQLCSYGIMQVWYINSFIFILSLLADSQLCKLTNTLKKCDCGNIMFYNLKINKISE